MIARHEAVPEKADIWTALAEPLPGEVNVPAVVGRLDAVVPGEWDLTLDLLPPIPHADDPVAAFKARIQILGVIREHVGFGTNYRAAANAALLGAAAMFQIGLNRATPAATATTEPEPAVTATPKAARRTSAPEPELVRTQRADPPQPAPGEDAQCPKCGGRMWDNRLSKRNPKAPDFKCRDRSCDGVIWPPRDGAAPNGARRGKPDTAPQPVTAGGALPGEDDLDGPLADEDDDLPF